MSMTREDVLRELELLPVWRLRAPNASPVELTQKLVEVQKNTKVKVAEIIEKPQLSAATEKSVYLLVSDDKKWAFVLPEALTGEADDLFNNILLALHINKTHTETLAHLTSAKVIVAMGAAAGQSLLASTDSLEQLRGKAHMVENVPLVVTYHPNDLLQHLANKANMWDDLCIAKPLAST